MRIKQQGSQLIETSIVLAIIALIFGAVIKGQEMINNARVKNLMADFRIVPVYLNSYEDQFRALPGDDAHAASHVAGATSCTTGTATCNLGNGIIDGNWNDTTIASESYLFWQHIRIAGIASGYVTTGTADYLQTNALGGLMGIQNGTSDTTKTPINATTNANPIRGSFIVCSQGIMGKLAKQLDIAMDDGVSNSGMMMSGTQTTVGTPMTAVATLNDTSIYTVCFGF
jgi:hypothetical protein